VVTGSPVTRPTRASAVRRVDLAATALLGAALPAGFRDRQRGEWVSDLGDLGPGARLSYLLGALRTLPGLRRSALRHGGGASGLEKVPLTGAGTAARILLFGLIWPVLSWILIVPVRYYALDVPARIASGTAEYDPQLLWPLVGTPEWTMPIWVGLYLGAWVAVLGGLFLLPAVMLAGTPLLLRRSRGRRGRLLGAAAVAAVALVAAMWSLSAGVSPSGFAGALVAGVNGVRTTGVLGMLAVLCAVRVRDLTRRVRAGLAVVGAAAVGMAVWTYASAGRAMLVWFMD
jgi:hypothetical protein